MSFNQGSSPPIQPLSIGNVVTAGLRLYGSHLKSYLKLGFIAYAWILVPVYGWARCGATLALISRLAYSELVEQPETPREAGRIVRARLWQFLVMGLLMFLLGIGITIGVIILLLILTVIAGIIIGIYAPGGAANDVFNPVVTLISFALLLVYMVVIFTAFILSQARFIVVEIPLAIESSTDGASTIGRSWNLTSGNMWRIVAIVIVTYIITLPLQVPLSVLNIIIQISLQPLVEVNTNYRLLAIIVNVVLTLISVAIVVPFWQTIKAVLYCDLLSRREGFGLKLRDRNI
ncbi:hypothetical protein NIES4071_96900 [Calothrix sp. NIES-4071]|nr:hypothetical protein NIES4071_96900 [Calothrix sp. NIES-4071]BAZ63955.1 hypothetical protein NIES4105_96830 [Calothrix sp. NIES-4105]